MYTILLIAMIISGLVFAVSVSLMNPKGGLNILGGGGGSTHEYGSQKSFESVLKNAAYISGAIFAGTAAALPFVG